MLKVPVRGNLVYPCQVSQPALGMFITGVGLQAGTCHRRQVTADGSPLNSKLWYTLTDKLPSSCLKLCYQR